MRRVATAVIALCVVAGVACSRNETKIEPKSLAPKDIPRLIRSLPEYTRFGISGLSYFKGRLYASTNLGLLVVVSDKVVVLYQWREQDAVVEGPWRDIANDVLWIQHASDGSLARYDGTSWHRLKLPRKSDGYTRGDMLRGFLGISVPQGFWFVGGGHAWRWESNGDWAVEPQPPAPQWSSVRAVAPVGDTLFYIVQEGIEAIPPSPYAVYDREHGWSRTPLKTMDFGHQIVVTPRVAYVRADDGTLFSISSASITPVSAPGPCEAITRTSTGELLASFRNRGIYLFADGEWKLKAKYPYDSNEGEHWAYIAEDAGQVAYATTSVPNLIRNSNKFTFSGTDALWVLEGKKLKRVVFE